MDKLVDSLSQSLEVSDSKNSIYSKHPRFDQYKSRASKSGDQNIRRDTFLKAQKKRRCDFINHVRCLAVGDWTEDVQEEESTEDMDVTQEKVRPPRRYKDQLMLSEWLVEVPEDFEKEWCMRVCPIGKRNLVVAAKGRTACYSKSGYRIDTFSSLLPGGNFENSTGYTILDAVYNQTDQTFFILDVMCWNGHPVYDSESEFRFFWLHSKLDETKDLSEVSMNNAYKIVGLNNYSCNKEAILAALHECEPSSVDGLLFYHKRTHYTFGTTPLVTWLKVPMIKEILGITPPQAFLSPSDDNGIADP